MVYVNLKPSGNPLTSFILFEAPASGPLRLRERYAGLSCHHCKKVDEYAALARGIDDVSLRSRKDFTWTADCFFVVSDRFRDAVSACGLKGLTFVEIPRSSLAVVRPDVVVATDPSRSQMKFLGSPCRGCGRYRETLFTPAVASMQVPEDPDVVFSPSLRPEKGIARFSQLMIEEARSTQLKAHKLVGIDWLATKRDRGDSGGASPN